MARRTAGQPCAGVEIVPSSCEAAVRQLECAALCAGPETAAFFLRAHALCSVRNWWRQAGSSGHGGPSAPAIADTSDTWCAEENAACASAASRRAVGDGVAGVREKHGLSGGACPCGGASTFAWTKWRSCRCADGRYPAVCRQDLHHTGTKQPELQKYWCLSALSCSGASTARTSSRFRD